jgi:hypothetical protein
VRDQSIVRVVPNSTYHFALLCIAVHVTNPIISLNVFFKFVTTTYFWIQKNKSRGPQNFQSSFLSHALILWQIIPSELHKLARAESIVYEHVRATKLYRILLCDTLYS